MPLPSKVNQRRQESVRISCGPTSVNVPIWYGNNEVAPPNWWNVGTVLENRQHRCNPTRYNVGTQENMFKIGRIGCMWHSSFSVGRIIRAMVHGSGSNAPTEFTLYRLLSTCAWCMDVGW